MDAAMVERYELAKTLAVEAGRSTLEFFQNPDLTVEKKGDHSPVTVADRNAEQLIRQRLADVYPGDAIVGEEFGETAGESGFRWILDPIDGTKSFISGVPLFGTMVGVEQDGQPLIGAIFFPGLDFGIYGCHGQPTMHGHLNALQPAQVSQTTSLSDAVFVTSESRTFAQRGAAEVYKQLEETCYVTRTWGDCYGYFSLIAGNTDIMLDPNMAPWDLTPLIPAIKGAGGVITTWTGEPVGLKGTAVATAPGIHDEVIRVLNTPPS